MLRGPASKPAAQRARCPLACLTPAKSPENQTSPLLSPALAAITVARMRPTLVTLSLVLASSVASAWTTIDTNTILLGTAQRSAIKALFAATDSVTGRTCVVGAASTGMTRIEAGELAISSSWDIPSGIGLEARRVMVDGARSLVWIVSPSLEGSSTSPAVRAYTAGGRPVGTFDATAFGFNTLASRNCHNATIVQDQVLDPASGAVWLSIANCSTGKIDKLMRCSQSANTVNAAGSSRLARRK